MSLKSPRRRSQKSLMTIMTIMTNDNHDHMHAELSTDVSQALDVSVCVPWCEAYLGKGLSFSAPSAKAKVPLPGLCKVAPEQGRSPTEIRSRQPNCPPKLEKWPKIAPKNRAKTSKKSPKINKKPSIFDQNQQKTTPKVICDMQRDTQSFRKFLSRFSWSGRHFPEPVDTFIAPDTHWHYAAHLLLYMGRWFERGDLESWDFHYPSVFCFCRPLDLPRGACQCIK